MTAQTADELASFLNSLEDHVPTVRHVLHPRQDETSDILSSMDTQTVAALAAY